MKRPISLLLTAALMLLLAACSSQSSTPFPQSLPQQLLETEAFSEPLEPLDADLVWMFYGLEDAGLAREQLIAAIASRSTGATCEEVALLTFADEASAQSAEAALQLYLSAQIEINKDYRPAELPKLKQAILERRGSDLLLLVANDYASAQAVINP